MTELECLLENPVTPQAEVFNALKRLVRIRTQQPAFHPDAQQSVIHINSDLFIIQRRCEQQTLFVIANVTERILELPLAVLGFLPQAVCDLLADPAVRLQQQLHLAPYQVMWLTQQTF